MSSMPPLRGALDGATLDLWRLARRVLWGTALLLLLLAVLDWRINWKEDLESRDVQDLFNLAREDSIPTWISSMQFAAVGAFALLAGLSLRRDAPERALKAGCLLVGVFFIYMGLDEALQFHERLGTFFADQHGGEDAQDSYGWQTYILPAYLVVGALSLLLVGNGLMRRRLLGWFLAGGILMALAQGIDHFEGKKWWDDWGDEQAAAWGLGSRYDVQHPILMAEELLEMLGVMCIGQAFLRLLAVSLDGALVVCRRT